MCPGKNHVFYRRRHTLDNCKIACFWKQIVIQFRSVCTLEYLIKIIYLMQTITVPLGRDGDLFRLQSLPILIIKCSRACGILKWTVYMLFYSVTYKILNILSPFYSISTRVHGILKWITFCSRIFKAKSNYKMLLHLVKGTCYSKMDLRPG